MSLPLSGSNIRLLTGIKWRNDYKHTRYFTTKAQQTSWFTNKTAKFSIAQANYVKVEGVYSLKIPYHIDQCWDINYMMFQNSAYTNKWFYCFVTKLEYLSNNTTRVYFEIDSFQTWFLESTFKPSYIERQHVTEYSNGVPTVNTIDEGLNYGNMYDTFRAVQVKPSNDVLFLVVVAKQLMQEVGAEEDEIAGEVTPVINSTIQPLTFYITPFFRDGTTPTTLPFNPSPVESVLKFMYKQQTAVNNIVSIYITDYLGIDVISPGTNTVNMPTENFKSVIIQGDTQAVNTYRLTKLYNYTSKVIDLGGKYFGSQNIPSKLFMSPYYKILVSDFQGHQIEILPEYINDTNLKIRVKGSLGVNSKVSYEIVNYNNGGTDVADRVGLEYGMINSNPNDVPIITDLLSAYLQGNKNSLAVQENQAVFNGVMGVAGSVGSVVSSAVARDVGGAINGAMSGVSSAGNTIFTLQGIQAKQQDIDNTPPSISNMGGDTYFSLGNQYQGVYVLWKRIKPEYQEILGDFFIKYGYKYNRIGTPNLNTRQSFNFVKTIDCLIDAQAPQDELVNLQNIFNNGITLWHVDDIGNYNLGNGVK